MPSYALPADLVTLSVAAAAISGVSSGDQQSAIDAASAIADDYLASRFTLPLVAPFPLSLKKNVCDLATYIIFQRRGWNPDGDPAVKMAHDDAYDWLKNISRNLVHPQVTDSSSAAPGGRPPRVISKTQRGW